MMPNLDTTQVDAFLEFLIGFQSVGVAGEEEITAPHSPELRAFVLARLGDDTPSRASRVKHNLNQATALAGLLRDVADGVMRDADVQVARVAAERERFSR